jgi:hypothetical protein
MASQLPANWAISAAAPPTLLAIAGEVIESAIYLAA